MSRPYHQHKTQNSCCTGADKTLTSCLPGAGNEAAFRRLLDDGAPRLGRPLFRSVWGLEATPDDSLALPEESAAENPLLAVMLARLKEGCRLLAHAGEREIRATLSFRLRCAAT